jgi:hypothetical protein
MVSFADRASVPSQVLVRFLEGESVLLNLDTERYFGLDSTGTRMWKAVTVAPDIKTAYEELLGEYDVDPQLLRSNLTDLLGQLLENGLLEVRPTNVGRAEAV